jgi:alkylation response protein AidB-like acyl-CoA dehydrogenase
MSLTLRRAFEREGVTLVYPSRSWGGVRYDDGAVVFAIRSDEVQAAQPGFGCLLWAPNVDGARPWADAAGGRERLKHCRLALAHGGAEALIVDGARNAVEPDNVLALRVVRRDAEYWARWASPSRAAAPVRLEIERRLRAA